MVWMCDSVHVLWCACVMVCMCYGVHVLWCACVMVWMCDDVDGCVNQTIQSLLWSIGTEFSVLDARIQDRCNNRRLSFSSRK